MAVEELKYFGRRKRKRGSGKRKLVVNERVEVMPLDLVKTFFFFNLKM